jgi:branched-chain amino acid transport system ATP-binding protein
LAVENKEGNGADLLIAKGVTSGYGGMQVLTDVDLQVFRGEIIVLLGANGSGKTTLLKALMSLIPLYRGMIAFRGRDVTKLRTDQKARLGLAYMSEFAVFPDLSIDENLSMGGYRLSKTLVKERKQELYAAFPVLSERKSHLATSLSGGQRKMLGFAKALMFRPELLLLDEPSAGLAPRIVTEMIEMMRLFHEREGVTMLIAEQNILFMSAASRGYVLENGRVVAKGTVQELERNDLVKQAYLGITQH